MKKIIFTLSLLFAISLQAEEVDLNYNPNVPLLYRPLQLKGPLMIARGSFFTFDEKTNEAQDFFVHLIQDLGNNKIYAKIHPISIETMKTPKPLNQELENIRIKAGPVFYYIKDKIIPTLIKTMNTYTNKIKNKEQSTQWSVYLDELAPMTIEIGKIASVDRPFLMTTFNFDHPTYGKCGATIRMYEKKPVTYVQCFVVKEGIKLGQAQRLNYKIPKKDIVLLQTLTQDGKNKKIFDPLADKYVKTILNIMKKNKDRIRPGIYFNARIPEFK